MQVPQSVLNRLLTWASRRHLGHRQPDFIIEGNDSAFLERWYVVRANHRWSRMNRAKRQRIEGESPRSDPRGLRCNVYVHRFLRSDEDRALHDHPWPWATLLLSGQYHEYLADDETNPAGPASPRLRQAGDLVVRGRAARPHRIELIDGEPAITLFLTGPTVREWGFWCADGWRHWKQFLDRGCGD